MRRGRIAGILACTFAAATMARSVEPAGIFTDHMVLQRGMEVPVWGRAAPGERITVRFNGQERPVRCGEDGRWEVRLDPMEAGGPYEMAIEGDTTRLLRDILVGDVWICSGQSNMWRPVSDVVDAEREIAEAEYPGIRIFAYPRTMSARPEGDIPTPHPDEARISLPVWQPCTPATIRDFSAVAYFFGRELHTHLSVPVGLIRTCWGSTGIESWMSRESVEASPWRAEILNEIADPLRVLDSVTDAYTRRIGHVEWKDPGMQGGTAVWSDPALDDSDWQTMMIPGPWERVALPGFDGIVWFRKSVFLPGEVTGEPFRLSLGRVYDENEVWINGRFVGRNRGRIPGSPYYGSQPVSSYAIRPGILKEGRNLMAVRVKNYAGRGGFDGDPCRLRLSGPHTVLSLSGEWKYRTGLECRGDPPGRVRPHQIPTVLYNGMIHPLIPLAFKGVAWYQGESNTGDPLPYRDLFPRMIRDWRERWGRGDFPFVFVQLANFGQPDTVPGDDNWALLREAQHRALSLPATGMAVTIDIGEADNIHPRNKQDVGRRLALAARHAAYGEKLVYSGPVFESMEVERGTVRIRFTHTGSGLWVDDKYGYVRGFALAGADREWHWARGRLEGRTVVLQSRLVKEPVAVRYAWSKNPGKVNLYNREGLPAVPFRTDEW